MHMDQTLDILDSVTTVIGEEFREFNNKTCPHFQTHELPRKRDAHKWHLAKKSHSRHGSSWSIRSDRDVVSSNTGVPLLKTLSIDTYKHHSLGDYPRIIQMYGTTDSYSTEPVSWRLISTWCYIQQNLTGRARTPCPKGKILVHRSKTLCRAAHKDWEETDPSTSYNGQISRWNHRKRWQGGNKSSRAPLYL